ncbi:MAG: hypothetical protein F6K31_31655 [Symploca sp. SIO2G7]|nr:hypothetical protein [Symploca sp. SIO2G7]
MTEQPLLPQGNPLTPQKLEAIARIKIGDEQKAIAKASPTLQLFLNASRNSTVFR